MSEALQNPVLSFDDPPRTPGANAARSEADAPQTIANTLRAAGVDAPASLYNEALVLAREGHLGQAASRLLMLVGLDPDDAEALLLLSKVHAAQGRPQEALARLDSAVAAGAMPPPGFREFLEGAIRVERVRDEEHKARLGAREQGEVKALRTEARHLRSETVRLETELGLAQDREKMWKFAAIGASALGTIIIMAMIVAGAPSDEASAPTAAVTPPAVAEAPDVTAPAVPVAADLPAPAQVAAPVAAPVAPAAAPAAEAPKKQGGKTVHVVTSGDTLSKLASRYYGDSSKWETIRDANKAKLKGGIALSLGDELVIP